MSIFVLATLSACTSTSGEPTLRPTEGIQLLAGEYVTQITAEDLDRFGFSSDPNLESNIGPWRLSLKADGSFAAEMQGQSIADGSYSIMGNEITINIHCADCDCNGSIDRFYWALEDDQLSFSHKAGTCKHARLLLTVHPLKRSP
jgi:hypothetical protein